MRSPLDSSPEFGRLARGDLDVSLEKIAFEIASDAIPHLDPAPYQAKLDEFADRVRKLCPRGASTGRILGQVRWVLHVEEGFQGDRDHYHDPANSYLPEVIDRKKGIPISLSLLYLAVGERLGLPLAGVSLPAHFMLRILDQPEPLFIDGFDEGRVLNLSDCEARLAGVIGMPIKLDPERIAPCSPREFVGRMLRNLREIHLRQADFGAALPVVRRIAALERSSWEAKRDWGVVAIQAGLPGEAISPLEECLAEPDRGPEAEDLAKLLRIAKRRVAELN